MLLSPVSLPPNSHTIGVLQVLPAEVHPAVPIVFDSADVRGTTHLSGPHEGSPHLTAECRLLICLTLGLPYTSGNVMLLLYLCHCRFCSHVDDP